jgi:hypothetical protein
LTLKKIRITGINILSYAESLLCDEIKLPHRWPLPEQELLPTNTLIAIISHDPFVLIPVIDLAFILSHLPDEPFFINGAGLKTPNEGPKRLSESDLIN